MRRILVVLSVALTSGCLLPSYRVDAAPLALNAPEPGARADTLITAPIRAHHRDGRIVLFHAGARLTHTNLIGRAEVFSPDLVSVAFADSVATKDLVSATVFRQSTSRAQSATQTAVTVALAGTGIWLLHVLMNFRVL